MSWERSLKQASLDGVEFQCRSTTDTLERALAQYEYPHRDGAEIEDLGAKATSFAVVAVVWGEDYENRFSALKRVLDGQSDQSEFDAHRLIHPIYGSLTVRVQRYSVKHSEDRLDYCEIDITFVEDGTPIEFFAQPSARLKTETVASKVLAAKDRSQAAFAGRVPSLADRLRALRARMNAVDKLSAMTYKLRGKVTEVIVAGLDVLTHPTSWATDTRAIIGAIAAAPRVAALRIEGSLAGFGMLRSAIWPDTRSTGALAAPDLPDAPVPGTPVVNRDDVAPGVILHAMAADLVLRERALELADAAGELLGLEADVITLTPDQIASMAAQTRRALQDAIESARITLGTEDAYGVVESLRDVAHAVLVAAEAIIVARPPLVEWDAPADGNLLLVAHWRYGDAGRADELARLNPDVAARVFVVQGETIRGFAQ